MSSVNKRTILLLIWLVILGGLYAAITHLSSVPGAPAAPPPPITKVRITELQQQWPQILQHASSPPLGGATAAYTLVEFGDFECPQCGKMQPVIEKMITDSHGKANLLFCQRPWSYHKWAKNSAEASLAAAAQGKFWPMYAALYSNQNDLEPGYDSGYAAQIGLNMAQFNKAMSSHQYLPTVVADTDFANSLNIDLTPTLLVHNNKTGEVTIYLGATSHLQGAVPGYQGVEELAAAPPWKTPKAPHAKDH